MRSLILLIFFGLAAGSCRKKESPPPPVNPPSGTMGKLGFTFQNVVGSQTLVLDNAWYTTDAGDSLKIREYKYYVTNFVLHGDSSEFNEPESYYLVDERKPSSGIFTIDSIPVGRYSKVSFLIGVDARRNTAGAQTGALDPTNLMFWDWNTGYIMAKLEGTSPQINTFENNMSYHMGGFSGEYSVLQMVTLTFPAPVEIKPDGVKNVHIKSDVLEWFKSPVTIRLKDYPVVAMTGPDALIISNNYADMFSIDHIE